MEKVERITNKFATPQNIITHSFKSGQKACALIVYPDLTDAAAARSVIFSLENLAGGLTSLKALCAGAILEYEITLSSDEDECMGKLLSGDMVLAVEGEEQYAVIGARSYTTRGITEPPTETVTKGPREGFIEDIKTNLSLLERRFKTPDLAIERTEIGRRTRTAVAICYLASVADPHVVKKLRKRIRQIDIDGITDSNFLVPYIEEKPLSLFSQVGVSEKPDVVAAKLLEGRVALVVDGSPMVLTVPFVLVEEFQSGEDYYRRASFGTFLRILRYAGLLVAVLLPGLYVALQNFHYTFIPVRFMMTLMTAIKGLPLSPLAETVFVLLLFEIIREASVRMPRAVGMAMSIVGALVLGETAVNAGIISSPAVMITALSSIALFTVPNLIGSMSILRLLYALIGGLFGLFGLVLAGMTTLHYICSLNGYGSPYLAPFAPLVYSDLKDSVERGSLLGMKKRPVSIPNSDKIRQG